MNTLYATLIFIFGSTLTSFFHLIAYRLPKKIPINGRSTCEACGQTLRWLDIIPIFGYLLNKGKCHHCKTKIKSCHMLIEIFGGMSFMIGYLIYGFTLDYIVLIIFLSVFMIESISDAYYRIVIDRIWMFGIIPLIVIAWINHVLLVHLLSASVLFITLYAIAWIAQKVYKKDALGGGDIKLYLFVGFLLPLHLGFLSLFIASLIGFLYGIIKMKQKNFEIPLVPFIFIGVAISLLYGEALIHMYLSLFGM